MGCCQDDDNGGLPTLLELLLGVVLGLIVCLVWVLL